MEIDRSALIEVFLAESEEQLAMIEQMLLQLERQPGDLESQAVVFRAVHTLKGNALSLGFAALGRLAHAAEDLLEGLRRKKLAVAPDVVTLLLRARDGMREALEDAAAGHGEVRPAHDALLAELERRLAGDLTPTSAPAAPQPHAGEVARPAVAAGLRVDVAKLDSLLALTGELAVARLRLDALLEALGPEGREALEAHRDAERLHGALQELVFQTRLVPLGPLLRQQQRAVRDLAAELGKQVELVIEGEDVEVDTSIVEPLRDALTHMVRNAVGHGIELPARRRELGKPAMGEVRLAARRDGSNVVVEVADDGGGLDPARIAARAVEMGLPLDPRALGERELLELVFLPGFSTADAVTGTSGRGVGMDVVRQNVERLRGSVRLDSRKGSGTAVALRLPLTIAMIEALRVGVAGETYVVALDDVVECLDMPAIKAAAGGSGGLLELRERPLPFLRLRSALAATSEAPRRENVVVVRDDQGEAGLAVDEVLGSGPAVVRPLGRLLRGVPGIAGSVILGGGEVALLLDVPALLRRARQATGGEAARVGA
jgi:two-component system chemotaxis sensor kinase CheA